MSTAAPAEAAAPAPAKKGGAIKLILAVLVAAGMAGGGAFFYMSKQAAAKPASAPVEGEEASDEHAEAKADDKGDPKAKAVASDDYFALSPQFVVNLNDPEAMRFLQAEVQVIASKTAAADAVRINEPIIRNRLMLLFSSQTYNALLTREGKEKLQLDAAAEINKVLDERKKPHINGVVFTNLVMQ
ncbi:MAG: flagellar basal body-associated FliL family protein [Pseudomonadota bacterium]